MGKYLISEVEKMTGVKGYILRRWEQKLPFFSPEKDYQGRRFYGDRDLETIIRMKHLVFHRGLSEEDAAAKLLTDAAANISNATSLTVLREIREQLGNLYLSLKKLNRKGNYGNNER